ncbi:MAG: hypothetical protein NXH83_10410 [Rhodobacteraceae bacterium]|nr:hypothetical protein [Paracoccaceae bacterium]
MLWNVCLISALLALQPVSASAELLRDGETAVTLPLTLRDGRPMLAAEVAGRAGVVMVDTGTAYPLMLNRDALDLPQGREVARGHAASGQVIVVMTHPAPRAVLAGRTLALPETALSGDFGFTREGLGPDFLGFLGLPALEDMAFMLDQPRLALTLLRPGPDGALPLAGPAAATIAAEVAFHLTDDDLPGWSGRIGDRPVAIDIDTGDSGTLYATSDTLADLVAGGWLTGGAGNRVLAGLRFGGGAFPPFPVAVVEAGGAADMRADTSADLLRLGASFLGTHPSLWNMPAGRIIFLQPGAPVPPDR